MQKIYQHQDLNENEMEEVANMMMKGELTDSELAAFLIALKMKGETAEEMTGLTRAVRNIALPLPYTKNDAMDNCGTGGDHSNSFNISTTSAFVLAAGGVKMAKHGNRSVSSRSGSADVCQALGIELELQSEQLAYLLDEVGIAFLYAPQLHPSLKHVMNVRKELKTPTIFNLIGPLTNPVPLGAQLLGIYRSDLLEQTATVLSKLGRKRAIVISGGGGLDEASLVGENQLALLEAGAIKRMSFTPEDVGLKRAPKTTIRGGNASTNAAILLNVLSGEPSAYLDTVLLNAGLGFFAYGKVSSIEKGVTLARQIILSGEANAKLHELLTKQKEVLAG